MSAMLRRLKDEGGIGRDALLAMTIRAAGLIVGFACHILLSRSLGADAYGRYAIVIGWALIFVIPTRMGLDTSAYKFASAYRRDGDTGRLAAFQRYSVRVMAIGTLFWAGIGMLVALLSAYRSGDPLQWAEVTAFAAMIFPLAAIGYFSVVFRTSGRIAASQVYEQLLRPAILSLGILWVIWRSGAVGLDIALLITVASLWLILLAMLIHGHRVQPMTGSSSSADDRRQWLRMGGTLLVISAAQELMNQADIILLGWAAQPQAAALFSAASRFASLVVFGLVAVGMVAASPIAVAFRDHDRAALAKIARQSAQIATAFALVVGVIVNAGGSMLLSLFGPEFADATTALAILTVGNVLNAATGVVAYLLSMTGNEKLFLAIVGVSLAVNVALNLLLVPSLGVNGAAIAAAVGLSMMNILAAIAAQRRVGVNGTIFARSVA